MNKTDGELMRCLKELQLPTARGCYQALADSARKEELSSPNFPSPNCSVSRNAPSGKL